MKGSNPMDQANRVHSTPPTNAPVDQTRRRFLSTAAGVATGGAALALATIPPAAVAAAPGPSALGMDGTKISQELWHLVHALQDADETLIAARAAYDAEYVRYEEWEKRTPAPRSNSRRAHRRWDGRQKAYMRGSNFFATQDAQRDASEVHRGARKAIAEYRAR